MNTEIYLNGIAVSDAVPKILINGVTVEKPEIKTSFADRPFGGRVKNSIYRSYMKITLEAQFRAVGKPIMRAECVDRLNAWASKGGFLTLSNRPGKRLLVECTQYASEGTLHKSAEVAQIVFETTHTPFWENETEDVDFITTFYTDETVNSEMDVDGTAETPVSAEITVTENPLSFLSIKVGSTCITLKGEETAAEDGTIETQPFAYGNEKVSIGYEEGILFIRKNGESIFSLMTPDSSDELIAQPGINTVSVTASAPVTCVFKANGRWV